MEGTLFQRVFSEPSSDSETALRRDNLESYRRREFGRHHA
jgi:hypothetical protein